MAGSAIKDNETIVVVIMCGEFLEEEGHAGTIHSGEDVGESGAIKRADSSVGVGIFPHHLLTDHRTDTPWCPTSFWVVDAAKTGFILKKDFERAVSNTKCNTLEK